MRPVLVTCLVLLAVAMCTGTVSRRATGRPARAVVAAGWWALVGAAACGGVAGGLGVAGRGGVLDLDGALVLGGSGGLRVDRLSGLFLLISCAVAVPALLAAVGLADTTRPRLPATLAVTLFAVVVVITADHLFLILFGWETLTVGFYLLVGFDRGRAGRGRAAIAAASFGKVSGAALLAGGALLAAHGHSLALAGLASARGSAGAPLAYALLLFGFAVKAGLLPVQVWLPPSYASAPAPARALMAGVAVNVAFYGMWRTLLILGPPPVWLAVVVLVGAGVTAVLGIAHAAVHSDLTGLIAWSSVENAGVITAGFGVALMGSIEQLTPLVALGLLAGTLQVIAHSLGKSLLFASAGLIEQRTGTVVLDRLRGVVRTTPLAGVGLVVGAMTLGGLPLTAGFASEWFTLEALMQQFRVSSLALRLAAAACGALIALTVGVAGLTFVRLVGLTALGAPPQASARMRATWLARIGLGTLAVACLAVSALAPLQVRLVAAGLRPIVGDAASSALMSPLVLQPVFRDFSVLSPSWLWIALPAMTLLALVVSLAFSGSRMWQVRRVVPWSSASPGVDRGVGYTSFGFANPMRRVLANLLRTRSQMDTAEGGAPPTVATKGVSRSLSYRVDVVEVVERFLYRPLVLLLYLVVRAAKRLQSGRLDAYLLYMLIAVLAVLAVATAAS